MPNSTHPTFAHFSNPSQQKTSIHHKGPCYTKLVWIFFVQVSHRVITLKNARFFAASGWLFFLPFAQNDFVIGLLGRSAEWQPLLWHELIVAFVFTWMLFLAGWLLLLLDAAPLQWFIVLFMSLVCLQGQLVDCCFCFGFVVLTSWLFCCCRGGKGCGLNTRRFCCFLLPFKTVCNMQEQWFCFLSGSWLFFFISTADGLV